MNYPHETGFVRHSDTSAASARKLDESGRAGTYDAMILDRLQWLGETGATAEEMRKYLNRTYPHVHNGSVNGRMSTLWRRREIVKCTAMRRTDANKQAHVYVHAAFRSKVQAEPEYAAVANDGEACRELARTLMQPMQVLPDGSAVIKLSPLEMNIINRLALRAGIKKG